MSAPLCMVLATFFFATMGMCVKFASAHYGAGEIVMYRGLVGVVVIGLLARAQGVRLATRVPLMHAWRSIVGVASLTLWFWAIARLPLGTAITLNYMSSIWMALFLIGGAVLFGAQRVDPWLVVTVLVGFAGVALVLQPSLGRDLMVPAMVDLASGMLTAMAYLQVATLGRAGEPELRVVYYFSWGGFLAGLAMSLLDRWHAHTAWGVVALLGVGVTATAAQVLVTRAYTIGRPLSNASLQYLGILFSGLYGVWLFDDPLTWPAVAGMVLIVGAGIVASRLRAQTLARAAPDTLPPPADS